MVGVGGFNQAVEISRLRQRQYPPLARPKSARRAAPEQLLRCKINAQNASDLWCVGIIILELAFGRELLFDNAAATLHRLFMYEPQAVEQLSSMEPSEFERFNVEVKKDRNLALSFANNQLTEVNGKELVFGTGYRWKNLELKNPFKKGKDKKAIKSDLNLKADFSIRQNLTVIRKVVEQVTQPTAGQTIYSLKTSADYMITQRITARLFYDWLFTNPRISTSFKSSNTNAGVSIRFSLT